jgi:hypothetical protein
VNSVYGSQVGMEIKALLRNIEKMCVSRSMLTEAHTRMWKRVTVHGTLYSGPFCRCCANQLASLPVFMEWSLALSEKKVFLWQ